MDEKNKGGAPRGSRNSYKGSVVRGAIRRALHENKRNGRASLQIVVQKMIADAEEGDKDARRELFDRIDGKPGQATDLNVSGGMSVNWPESKNALDE